MISRVVYPFYLRVNSLLAMRTDLVASVGFLFAHLFVLNRLIKAIMTTSVVEYLILLASFS